jgi:hypothetical protein
MVGKEGCAIEPRNRRGIAMMLGEKEEEENAIC